MAAKPYGFPDGSACVGGSSCTRAVLPAKYGPVRFEESKPMRGGEVAQPENFCMRKRKELELTERHFKPIIICTQSYGSFKKSGPER